jgi:hypothetical protein
MKKLALIIGILFSVGLVSAQTTKATAKDSIRITIALFLKKAEKNLYTDQQAKKSFGKLKTSSIEIVSTEPRPILSPARSGLLIRTR